MTEVSNRLFRCGVRTARNGRMEACPWKAGTALVCRRLHRSDSLTNRAKGSFANKGFMQFGNAFGAPRDLCLLRVSRVLRAALVPHGTLCGPRVSTPEVPIRIHAVPWFAVPSRVDDGRPCHLRSLCAPRAVHERSRHTTHNWARSIGHTRLCGGQQIPGR